MKGLPKGLKDAFDKATGESTRRITDRVSDVLSAPARIKSALKQRRSKIDYLRIKRARSYGNAPDFNEDGTVSDAFKARSLSREVKNRLTKKKK